MVCFLDTLETPSQSNQSKTTILVCCVHISMLFLSHYVYHIIFIIIVIVIKETSGIYK